MPRISSDPALYSQLVEQHARELYRFAYRFSGRHDVAEDLVQETFAEAWRSLPRLRDRTRARGWLLRILRHQQLRRVRERERPGFHGHAELPESGVGRSSNPDILSAMADQEALQNALDDLDPRFREAFLLVVLGGCSTREAADILEIPPGTLLSRVHRGRDALRQSLLRMGVMP